MLPLALLFILWPILELALLIRIGEATSAGTAIALAVLPAILGAFLAKREGLKAWYRIQQALAAGEFPGDQLFDALLILISGVLLITPGLLSDAVGLLLLLPPVRRFARVYMKRRFRAKFTVMHFGSTPGRQKGGDGFVDVEAHEVERKRIDKENQGRE